MSEIYSYFNFCFQHRGSGKSSKMSPNEPTMLQDTQANFLKQAAWGSLYCSPDVFADMLMKGEWVQFFRPVYLLDFCKDIIVSYDSWTNRVAMFFFGQVKTVKWYCKQSDQ